MIDLANMTENSTLLDLQNRLKALEAGNISANSKPSPALVTRPVSTNPIEKGPVIAKEKVENTEQSEELFTPPPMSKKSDGKDILSLWQELLENITSPPTQAMLKLAIPIQISKEGVIIAFKNEIHISRINDSNKKQIIQEAVKTMFNNSDVPVTIRLATSTDSVQAKPTVQTPVSSESKPEVKKVIEEPVEKTAHTEENLSQESDSKRVTTDQEKMILDLFEGKYVE